MELTPEQLAADENISPEKLLKELRESNKSAIRKAVCANPNTAINIFLLHISLVLLSSH